MAHQPHPTPGRPVAPIWAILRYGLLALVAAVAVGLVAFGVRQASFVELTDHLRTGQVTQLTLVGEMPDTSTGTRVVDIRWHDGILPRSTSVLQVRGIPEEQVSGGASLPLIRGSVADDLTTFAPHPPSVTHVTERSSITWQMLGWQVPAWVGIAALAAALGTLLVLITGPQTRLATRWAWFWMLGSVVGLVVVPVFLLWGQPRTGQPELAYTKAGRFTGGWAFLVFSVLASTLFPGLRSG